MRTTAKFGLSGMLLLVVAIAGLLTASRTSAQSSSGQFNAQTQFSVGTQVHISSVYGLESVPAQFPTPNLGPPTSGNHTSGNGGRNGTRFQPPPNGSSNQEWNLTYLRSTPVANSSITINAQVTNDTNDGGIAWTILSGTITYNGTTLTITSGKGGIGRLDHIVMVGNATDPEGSTLRWSLDGLAALYNGTVIVSLTGGVAELNPTISATRMPGQRNTPTRLVGLTYIATLS
ncbi:MAG TPA: hypothetical protein VLV18_09745 [Terriglobales bacterium]|nr:hypothetical protein [Terriglobales bacterium]